MKSKVLVLILFILGLIACSKQQQPDDNKNISINNVKAETIIKLEDNIKNLNDTIQQLKKKNSDLISKANKISENFWHGVLNKIIIILMSSMLLVILYLIYLLRTKMSITPKKSQQKIPIKNEDRIENWGIKKSNDNKTISLPLIEASQFSGNSLNQFIQQPTKPTAVVEKDLPKSFSNIFYELGKNNVFPKDWFVVGGSSIGKTHITVNKPCQDNHYCINIKQGWGVAVVADGAGSEANSHLGSNFVAEKACKTFKKLLQDNYTNNDKLPNTEEWNNIARCAFKSIYNELLGFTQSKNLEIKSVACTTIVVVFTPIGLLSAHIGDGRAGYCNENGEWKSLITPHKGEEANQTIFITSSPWINVVDFSMSEVLVPEANVITEKVIAFTLMSDGCESHSFDCSKMDSQTNKWIDLNVPSKKFFDPLLKQLAFMGKAKIALKEANAKWLKLLEEGTDGLKNEPDDKTLIFAILV